MSTKEVAPRLNLENQNFLTVTKQLHRVWKNLTSHTSFLVTNWLRTNSRKF